MAPAAPFRRSLDARAIICQRCLKTLVGSPRQQTRPLHLRTLEKMRLSEQQWDYKAEQIRQGEVKHLWDEFKDRGYVKDVAGTDKQIREIMRRKRIGAYVGIDPTAPSLHIGHLLPLMPLFWMYLYGYKTISVVGGATAKIGDPEGRLQDRDKIARSDLGINITKIHYQLKRIWQNVDAQGMRFGYTKDWAWSRAVANNSQWYNSLSFPEVVTRLFSGIRVSSMLSRDTVKKRMASGNGMPLDEFLYPLIQAWDFWHLYSSPLHIQMQIGGSDQYGNIVEGVNAIKHLRNNEPDEKKRKSDDLLNAPIGFTVPLMTDSSGAKFGKSAGNAVWLDPFMTSSYDLYGYFMRRPDADMEKLLRLLTFIPLGTIKQTMEEHMREPSKRVAQHALAFEVVCLIHSRDIAEETRSQHQAMYSKSSGRANSKSSKQDQPEFQQNKEISVFPADVPATAGKAANFNAHIKLPESLVMGKSIGRILYASGLAASASDGHRLCKHQGAYVGGAPGSPAARNKGMSFGDLTFTPIKLWFPEDTRRFLIDGKLLVLRRGKHFIRVVEMVSDQKWKASGRSYPGEPGSGQIRRIREALKQAGYADDETGKIRSTEIRELAEELENAARMNEPNAEGKLFFPKGKLPFKPNTTFEGQVAPRAIRRREQLKADVETIWRKERQA